MSDEAPKDAGHEETLPGQTEIIAGTVEHEKLLTSYANVSSYGPDHNVVLAAPTCLFVPHVQQAGDKLTCTMGEWTGVPSEYAYQWVLDAETPIGDGTNEYVFAPEEVGHAIGCVVSATNEAGTGVAPMSNVVVVA